MWVPACDYSRKLEECREIDDAESADEQTDDEFDDGPDGTAPPVPPTIANPQSNPSRIRRHLAAINTAAKPHYTGHATKFDKDGSVAMLTRLRALKGRMIEVKDPALNRIVDLVAQLSFHLTSARSGLLIHHFQLEDARLQPFGRRVCDKPLESSEPLPRCHPIVIGTLIGSSYTCYDIGAPKYGGVAGLLMGVVYKAARSHLPNMPYTCPGLHHFTNLLERHCLRLSDDLDNPAVQSDDDSTSGGAGSSATIRDDGGGYVIDTDRTLNDTIHRFVRQLYDQTDPPPREFASPESTAVMADFTRLRSHLCSTTKRFSNVIGVKVRSAFKFKSTDPNRPYTPSEKKRLETVKSFQVICDTLLNDVVTHVEEYTNHDGCADRVSFLEISETRSFVVVNSNQLDLADHTFDLNTTGVGLQLYKNDAVEWHRAREDVARYERGAETSLRQIQCAERSSAEAATANASVAGQSGPRRRSRRGTSIETDAVRTAVQPVLDMASRVNRIVDGANLNDTTTHQRVCEEVGTAVRHTDGMPTVRAYEHVGRDLPEATVVRPA